jgi:hypothetical protein
VTSDDWLTGQARALESLRGRSVERWGGVELALWGAAEDDPRFGDATLPCLHLFGLQAVLTDGAVLSIDTAQDDAYFGLRTSPEARFDSGHWEGIYRRRALPELPVGQVEQVAVFAAEGVLAEVDLRIDGRPLLLVAGELDGTPEDGLLLHWLDDSVLAFTEPGAAGHATWTMSRSDRRLITWHPA